MSIEIILLDIYHGAYTPLWGVSTVEISFLVFKKELCEGSYPALRR